MKSENRCICGHRFKEHAPPVAGGKQACGAKSCKCKDFFYMVAEGAWIIRCRCKHKHTEHDPTPPYKCTRCVPKPGAKPSTTQCSGFDSPFVCNCDHGWAAHAHVWEERSVVPLLDQFGDPSLVRRGLDEDGSAGAEASSVPPPPATLSSQPTATASEVEAVQSLTLLKSKMQAKERR